MIEFLVRLCCRHARLVVGVLVLLGLASAAYVARNFAINTNSEDLISPNIGWRKVEAAYDAKFPQQNHLTLIVIDGATPEIARMAAVKLQAQLAADKTNIVSTRRPPETTFFERYGLLFLDLDKVKSTTSQIISAQPFLGALAADPSLRGLMDSLSTALQGVERGDAKLADLKAPIDAVDGTLARVLAGENAYLSWQQLVTGQAPSAQDNRAFLEVQAKLDYNALMPGAKASSDIRATAARLGLTPQNGVRIRLTGPIPLSDEEFASLQDRALAITGAMLLAVLVTLWLAVKSPKIIASIALTVFVGLAITMAFGLLAAGVFNIISIAFVALFVGLGVDFGIQFSVRYREERHLDSDIARALAKTGRHVGLPVGLAAAATAAGFFSFLPTKYVGVAELGLIAGFGMLAAYILSMTLLPSLLMLLKPHGEPAEIGLTFLEPLGRLLQARRRILLIVMILAGLGAIALANLIRFDADPLDLRNPHSQSVSTIRDLARDLQTTPNVINVMAPSLADADALAGRLGALPGVSQVMDLKSFVPDGQQEKLRYIEDASTLMGLTLDPFAVKPAPTEAETVAALQSTADGLAKAAGALATPDAASARRLAQDLTTLVQGDAALRARSAKALLLGLPSMLEEVSASLQAAPVTLQSLPGDLIDNWRAADGTARIEVFPKLDLQSSLHLAKLGAAVLRITPEATGGPISIPASGRTIVHAFISAGVGSLLAIFILLAVALRDWRGVALTLLPLVWAALMTLGTCVLLNLELNFANIIALPLFLGIGVAFSIYYVVAWRSGEHHLLTSSLSRAILFSGLTTGSAFGSLAISNHPGTASMGELLMISLAWTLLTTMLLLPPILSFTRPAGSRRD